MFIRFSVFLFGVLVCLQGHALERTVQQVSGLGSAGQFATQSQFDVLQTLLQALNGKVTGCGNQGMMYAPEHEDADADGCVGIEDAGGFPACEAGEALTFDGTSFSCIGGGINLASGVDEDATIINLADYGFDPEGPNPHIIVAANDPNSNGAGSNTEDASYCRYAIVSKLVFRIECRASSNYSSKFDGIGLANWLAAQSSGVVAGGGGGSCSPDSAIKPGWPDALHCGGPNGKSVLYLDIEPATGHEAQYTMPYTHRGSGSGSYCLRFKSDKSYHGSCGGATGSYANCINKSIETLVGEGKGLYFGVSCY